MVTRMMMDGWIFYLFSLPLDSFLWICLEGTKQSGNWDFTSHRP